MSNVYSMEPRPNGKVNINTTHGLLSVELWGKECPLACRNFIQLCLEGYYDQSPFHRLVPGFCLQGGIPFKKFEDEKAEQGSAIFPTGRFPIETHSRLKFNRRGLMGMVALDQNDPKSSNGSQLFFTLSETSELNGRATLFGRVVGDTIFNLLRMSELEIDPKTESPLYPPRILQTEVVQNPFNDIIPRERIPLISLLKEEQDQSKSSSSLKKKNVSLLSFADDEVNEPSKTNFNSTKPEKETIKTSQPAIKSQSSSSSLQFLHQMKSVQMKDTQDKIKAMEEELGFRAANKKEPETQETTKKEQKQMSALEKHKAKFAEGRKKQKIELKDEVDTLLLLNSFRQKIQKTQTNDLPSEPPNAKKHLDICKLHGLLDCLSCRDNFNINLNAETAELDEKDWMMHKLVFDRRELDKQVRDDLKELVVIDPREQAEKIKSNKNPK